MTNSSFSTEEEKYRRTKVSPTDGCESLQKTADCWDPLSTLCRGNSANHIHSLPILFFISLYCKYYLGPLQQQLLIHTNQGSEINLSPTSFDKYVIYWNIQTPTSLLFKLIWLTIVISYNKLPGLLRISPHNDHFMLISTFHSAVETTELSAHARN